MKGDPNTEQLLALMDADINAGTAAAFEAYGGLVWSACARRLEDPEDIRECVNDTFLAFSSAYRKYDPALGSLGNYLCTIALRRATDRYRKLRTLRRAEEQYRECLEPAPEEACDREDLEAALEQLDPVDAQILREKYYNGMTYQQIARSIGLPYDTVKKRGQRNLRKLRFLLIGMILALLAAGCAYIIYRSFQFAEGAGPNFDPDRPIYQLSSVEGEPFELEGGTLFPANAIYQEGTLYVEIGFAADEEWAASEPGPGEPSRRMQLTQLLGNVVHVECTDADGSAAWVCGRHAHYAVSAAYGQQESLFERDTPIEGDELKIRITLAVPDLSLPEDTAIPVEPGLITQEDIAKLEQSPPAWTVTLEQPDYEEGTEAFGTFYDYLDTGLLVRDGAAYSDGAYVTVYPYQQESAYTLSAMLLHNFSGFYDDRRITLTGEDGTVYTADRIYGSSLSPLMERQISFPGAAAGEYTLTIPFLCLIREETIGTVTIPVPTVPDQELPLDETIRLSDGSVIRLTGIRYTQRTVDGFLTDENGEEIPQKMTEWDYIVECEVRSGEELVLAGFTGTGVLALPGAEAVLSDGASLVTDDPVLTFSTNPTITDYEPGAPYELTLTLTDPVYILEEEIRIGVTIRELDVG